MLPHTGLFLLGKVALQMRIRRPFISNAKNMPSFPRTRESRPLGTEIYRVKRFLRFYVLVTKFQTAFKRYGCVNNGRVGFSLPIPIDSAVFTVSAESCKLMPSFPRRRESRPLGTEIYRVKRFLRFYVLDSRVRGNDGRGFPFFPIDSRGFSVTRFPRSRE
ncbi:putative phage associated protein [Neisseria meningitidis]|nr:putative phage associated protein [Neisseria meningitidis]